MSSFTANDVTIFYSDQSQRSAAEVPAVLLISGLGSQHTSWRPEFIHRLIAAGYRVLTMDNRDVGFSSHFAGDVVAEKVLAAVVAGETPEVPYLLSDMAGDCVHLLDHLNIEAAHIVGLSMGGMIAQTFAIEHPGRTLSLTSIMSTTGDPEVGEATAAGEAVLSMPVPQTRAEAIQTSKAIGRALATDGTYEDEIHEAEARASIGRNYDNAGVGRQLAAIYASGNRTEQLAELSTPTLVIHGSADPLIGLSGGTATADAVPDATLLVVDGMGHDLPIGHWQTALQAMIHHFDSVELPEKGIRILPANADHADQLVALANRAFKDRPDDTANPANLTSAEHRDLIGDGCHELWDRSMLVGACYTRYRTGGNWSIQSIFVDPQQHRKGIATQLLEYLDRSLPWCKQIDVSSPPDIQDLWKASGYRSVERSESGITLYRRDSWQLPWVPTIAQTVAAAAALADDIEAHDLDGISLLDDETAAQFSDMLTGYVDELEGRTNRNSESPVADGRRWMRNYLRTFRGTDWMKSGGHVRMMVVHSMLRRLATPAKNQLLDLCGLDDHSPPADQEGRSIWDKADVLIRQLKAQPQPPDHLAAKKYLVNLKSELSAAAGPDLIFGGGSNQAMLIKAERISGDLGARLAEIVTSVSARAESIYSTHQRI